MSVHIVPRKTYFSVFGALLVFTALTVTAANINFGKMNDVIAMTIAVIKMMLVLLFFMHVRYSSRLIWVIVASMFFWLYFAMTGLHALHMIIGMGIIAPIMYWAWKGRYSPEYHAPVENFGLYWHFVDIIWIFLFPLLYLLGAHFGEGH